MLQCCLHVRSTVSAFSFPSMAVVNWASKDEREAMRVKCPHCGARHDVSHRVVITEADRLRDVRNGRPAAVDDESSPEVDGNRLTPEELNARRLRDVEDCKEE